MRLPYAVVNTRRSSKETIPNYAYGFIYSDSLKRYLLPDSVPEYDVVVYLDGIEGDGSINSTTGDLLKWDRALKNHLLLSEATQKEMLSPQSLADTSAKTYYGYGVLLGKNELGKYITHGGGWPGYNTNLVRYVDEDLTIIALSNNNSQSQGITGTLAYILFNEQVFPPRLHKQVEIDTSILNKYIGRYNTNSDWGVFELKKNDGKLYFRKGTFEIELKPESSFKFFHFDPEYRSNIQIEFEPGKSGKDLKTFIIAEGLKREMIRL